jgi:hypothetical protein
MLWKPNPGGQTAFATDLSSPYCALEGGWGSGKTWIGARKLILLHRLNAFDLKNNATGVPSCVVAPSYQNAMDFDVPALQDAMDQIGLRWVFYGHGSLMNGRFHAPALIIPDWSTRDKPSVILIRTADAPERITGWEVGAAWGDEPTRWIEDREQPKRDPYLQLLGRVRHPKARIKQALFTYTNEGDGTRIYEDFNAGKPGRALYRAATKSNPKMIEYEAHMRQTLTPELVEQYLEGKAINLKGRRIYPEFERSLHVDQSLTLERNLPLCMAIDFNINPGMHAEIGQSFPGDLLTVVHEIHQKDMDVGGMVKSFARLVQSLGGWQWPELWVFGDASGKSRWAGTGETSYGILRGALDQMNIPYRMFVPQANPPVIDRLNAFNCALRDLAGRVHWKCHPRCERIIADLQQMKRDSDGTVDKKNPNLSHPSDAEGYRVWKLRPVRRVPMRDDDNRVNV